MKIRDFEEIKKKVYSYYLNIILHILQDRLLKHILRACSVVMFIFSFFYNVKR